MEISGLVICETEESYKELTTDKIKEIFEKEFSVTESVFKDIMENTLKELKKIMIIK